MGFLLCQRQGKTLYEIGNFRTYQEAETYARQIGIWDYRIISENIIEDDVPDFYPDIEEPEDFEEPEEYRKHGFGRVMEASKRTYQKAGLFNPLDPLGKKKRLQELLERKY